MVRDYRLDIIRIISCCCIVITHLLQYYDIFLAHWMNSAVCTFFLLSGILMSNSKITNTKNWMVKRFSKILTPYYFVIIPAIIIFLFYFDITIKEIFALIINMSALLPVPSGFRHLWFLTGIGLAYLITPFFIKNKTIIYFIFIISFLGILYFFRIFNFELVVGLSCYLIGLFFSKNILSSRRNVFFSVLFLFFIFIITNLYFQNYSLFSTFRYPFLGLTGFYLIYHSKSTEKYVKRIGKRQKKIILWLSELTYPIYLVHGFFALGPLSVLGRTDCLFLNLFIFISIIVIISQLIYQVTNNVAFKKLNKKNV